jgi:hypothetical protein
MKKAVEDWENKDLAAKTVDSCTEHFKKANKRRLLNLQETAQEMLAANSAKPPTYVPTTRPTNTTNTTPTSGTGTGLEGWKYCHTHGICKHSGDSCPAPSPNHIKEATLSNRRGGCTRIVGVRIQRPRNETTGTSPTNT